MGRTEDWAWLCEDGEEAEVATPPVTLGQALCIGIMIGIVIAAMALIVGWVVSA